MVKGRGLYMCMCVFVEQGGGWGILFDFFVVARKTH